ncbi:MAG: hypothetical protein NTZ65_04365 [Candidatus Berkelbacteria bacterium]|nr:hypothetical protein [Candidatus Berkelbacteria bacterium]
MAKVKNFFLSKFKTKNVFFILLIFCALLVTSSRAFAMPPAGPIISIIKKILSNRTTSVLVEKKFFLNGNETSTFETGDTVVARIKVTSNNAASVNAKIRDFLPVYDNFGSNPSRKDDCKLSDADRLVDQVVTPNADGYVDWNNQEIAQGDTYYCYKFKLLYDFSEQNRLVSARTIVLDSNDENQALGTANSYLMVKGVPWINSKDGALDTTKALEFQNDDKLLNLNGIFSGKVNASATDNSTLGRGISYLFQRGLGQKSRGGTMLSLPVKISTSSGSDVLAYDPSYLMYSPAFYLFGNLFSGGNTSSTALDFGSRSQATTQGAYDPNNKLNAATALYNYQFDKNSVIYWDDSNKDKNKTMYDNIQRFMPNASGVLPDNTCNITATGQLKGALYLDNANCKIHENIKSSFWPNGRVWYYKATGDNETININGPIYGKGTVIVDFNGKSNGIVNILTTDTGFTDNDYLGLIVINGGKVKFTPTCTKFNGIVFAPGK